MTLSSEALARVVRTSRVLRGEDAVRARVAPLDVIPQHNRRFSDRLPPVADQLATSRQEGWDEGYQAGLEAAMRSAALQRDEVTRRAAEALRAAADRIAEGRAEAIAVVQHDAAELAFELTRTLVGHELAASARPGLDAVSRALHLALPGEELVVRMHPAEVLDAGVLQDLVPNSVVTVVADRTVEAGGCIVDSGPCRIDAQIKPALERVRAALEAGLRGEGGNVRGEDGDVAEAGRVGNVRGEDGDAGRAGDTGGYRS